MTEQLCNIKLAAELNFYDKMIKALNLLGGIQEESLLTILLQLELKQSCDESCDVILVQGVQSV